ncbi:MAG: arylsulfatase A-like enzyme, partial [Pseudohongiellaceae bacterium]
MKSSKKHWLKSVLRADSPSWTVAVVFVVCCTVGGCQEGESTRISKIGAQPGAGPAVAQQEAPEAGSGAGSGAERPSMPERPNLLLVTLDTLRADRLGCYGYDQASTPVVDALAARGVLFEQAFTPAPMTLPAHTTMMTGLLPPQHGARVNGEHRLGNGLPTLAEQLSAVGYRTGAFIAAFVLDEKFGLARGFDYYGDDLSAAYEQEVAESLSSYRPGATVVDDALQWLESGDLAAPLFAWVHLYDAHFPWHAHDVADGQDAAKGTYDGEVSYADQQVGRLLSALSQRGSLDNTVVMIVADHGEGLGDHHEIEHGYLLNEEVLHVPWIIAGPGVVMGQRCPSLVSLEDLLPTALALLDVPADSGDGSSVSMPGRSLLPALQGESVHSGISYAETDLPWTAYHWAPQRSLTTNEWKYVDTPQAELYDRTVDRSELVNLVDVRPQITQKMQARLAALEDQLGETLSEAALLTADEAESLAALGYVGSAGGTDSPADRTDLADVKERLAAKDLSATLRQREAAGDLSVDERLAMFTELVELSPETPSFRSQLGSAWVDVGRTEDGLMQMAAAVELAPGSAALHYDFGDALQLYG